MATMLETPSRIWRRIEAREGRDIPSLPSIPLYEDSAEAIEEFEEETTGDILNSGLEDHHQEDHHDDGIVGDEEEEGTSKMHSTPMPPAARRPTSAPPSATAATASTTRFAQSVASRSRSSLASSASTNATPLATSRGLSTRQTRHESFTVSFDAPSLPKISPGSGSGTSRPLSAGPKGRGRYSVSSMDEANVTRTSVPDVYLPPLDDGEGEVEGITMDAQREMSLADVDHEDGLPSFMRATAKPGSQPLTPASKKQDASIVSEAKMSPFDKYRFVAMRRGAVAAGAAAAVRTRTPSLSHTLSSSGSSPSNSTPHSGRSVELGLERSPSLPRSRTVSPRQSQSAPEAEEEGGTMDMTDIQTRDEATGDLGSVLDSAFEEESRAQGTRDDEGQTGGEEQQEPASYDGTPQSRQGRYSSPGSTTTTTPVARQRTRFELSSPSFPGDYPQTPKGPGVDRVEAEGEDDGEGEEDDRDYEDSQDDLVTPQTRRRSFFLSVIHSTARPKLAKGTPHPKRQIPDTPSVTGTAISSGGFQMAFSGVTPRPRAGVRGGRASTGSGSSLAREMTPVEGNGTSQPTTPSGGGAYDATVDRASFISTASSHDLALAHQRANTSFDPAMGFGGGGVGKFNANKLNNYLHGLNRRLQEENEGLMQRLRRLEEEKGSGSGDTNMSMAFGKKGRRSSMGTVLGEVKEDAVAESWLEEKAELEEMVETFKQEALSTLAEKEELEKNLEQEKKERERDKERWKSRMAEVEAGVSGIIADLEGRLASAEEKAEKVEEESSGKVKALERDIDGLRGDRDSALERAEKAERALESGKDLGGAVAEANQRVAQVMADLRNATSQIKELEEEAAHADARIEELEGALDEEKEIARKLEEELDEMSGDETKLKVLEKTVEKLGEELKVTKQYVDELEEGAAEAMAKFEEMQNELEEAQEALRRLGKSEEEARRDLKSALDDAARAEDAARQMEEALEEAEEKMLADEVEMNELKAKLSAVEREREREAHNRSEEVVNGEVEPSPTEDDLKALEAELDEAHVEIAKLNGLLAQSPARKAIDNAKDVKIEMLERDKEELLERNRALRLMVNEMPVVGTTPSRVGAGGSSLSGISPIHRHVLSMSMRMPKTPGGPLGEASWLNSTHMDGQPSASPLVAEISRLRQELDRANESIDDKLDKLEDAGLGVVGLAKKLGDARSRIGVLEDEIARLEKREERKVKRLSRVRCKKCLVKMDLRFGLEESSASVDVSTASDGLPDEPATPPTKTSEALKENLQNINSHLDELKKDWEDEKKRLVGEKAMLEKEAKQLQHQLKSWKEENKKVAEKTKAGEKGKVTLEAELDKAKRTILALENELGSERGRLRSMMAEQDRVQRDKKQIEMELQRTESDMNDVREQLTTLKRDNKTLEKELRENQTAEQKARLLERKVQENMETIETLRAERSLLSANHKDLQKRFVEVTESASKLRKEYSAHANSHDHLRQEVDMHRMEIDDLKKTLESKTHELHRVEKKVVVVSSRAAASDKGDVARTISVLEADLKRVRKDAEEFGKDLRALREEKDKMEKRGKVEISKAEKARKQAQVQIKALTRELELQRELVDLARDDVKSHVCAVDGGQLSSLKLQHNKQCKGLLVQIHYLQAKFAREHIFRLDLVYQKDYLLVLLKQFEKSERTIFASIARIGFPVAAPHLLDSSKKKKTRKLKSVVTAVVFAARVKRLLGVWQEQKQPKAAVLAALEEVRRKRALMAV